MLAAQGARAWDTGSQAATRDKRRQVSLVRRTACVSPMSSLALSIPSLTHKNVPTVQVGVSLAPVDTTYVPSRMCPTLAQSSNC